MARAEHGIGWRPLGPAGRVHHRRLTTARMLPGGNCAVICNGALKRRQRNRLSHMSRRTLCGSCTPGRRNSWSGRATRCRRPAKLSEKTDIAHTVDDLRLADRGCDRPQSHAQGDPSFRCQIEPKRGSDNQWTVHGKTEPEFNLAITASGIFDLSITEEISDLLSHGLPFGDADAFAALAGRTASLLGLQIMSPLNAGSLESIISREPGVYNAAISVPAESSSYTSNFARSCGSCRPEKTGRQRLRRILSPTV